MEAARGHEALVPLMVDSWFANTKAKFRPWAEMSG